MEDTLNKLKEKKLKNLKIKRGKKIKASASIQQQNTNGVESPSKTDLNDLLDFDIMAMGT